MRKLKILITYYSGTGNTEKIAYAIKEGITGHDVDLFPVKQVDPTILSSYDIVFVGSGIYGFAINRKIMRLIKKALELPSKFVYFYTHESSNPWPDAFKSIRGILEKNNCEVLDEFECCGENLKATEEQRQAAMKNLPPEKKKEMNEHYKMVKGRPNSKDLENAKQFAKLIIKKL